MYALWLGTQDGLNRFDGKNFEVFTADNTPGLNSSYIKCSVKDKSGKLWFGTNNGITVYNPNTEVFNSFLPTKSGSFQVEDIIIGPEGNIWLASSESGVYKFDVKTGKFNSFYDVIPSTKTTKILFTNGGKLIAVTEDQGIFICNTHQRTTEKFTYRKKTTLPFQVNTLKNDGDNILLGTSMGIYTLSVANRKIVPSMYQIKGTYGELNVTALHNNVETGWFFATRNNGLFTLFTNGTVLHSVEDIFQKNALLFNQLNVIFEDKSGIVWLGSQRGLTCFEPAYKGFMGVGPSSDEFRGITFPGVWSFDESPDAKYLFIGTDGGISRLNKHTGVFEQYIRKRIVKSNVTDEKAVLSLHAITKDRALVGCADGFFELNIQPGKYTYKQIKLSPKEGLTEKHIRIYSIQHWKDQLYFAATKDGVILYDAGKKKISHEFAHNERNPGSTLSPGVCRVVFKDHKGDIWFATSTGGLNKLYVRNGTPLIKPYIHNKILKSQISDYIACIHEDKKGVFWLGTMGSGLIRWDENKRDLQSFTRRQGLPNDVIYGILADKKNNLWLSTNKGLSSYNILSGEIKNYSEFDGLMSNEFNLGAYLKSLDENLYFGGIYGYTYFNPAEITPKSIEIKVVFTRFKLDNKWLKPDGTENNPLIKAVYQTKEIDLGYRQRSFSLKFQTSVLNNFERMNYKYILEGSDEGEVILGTNNEIHFSALSPGNYTLKVYARFGDGSWNNAPAIMQITIRPPFWSTWWFWIIMLILLAVSVRILVYQRTAVARRDKIKLEMKIRERTREIQLKNEKIELQKQKIEEERNKVIKQQELLQIEKDKTEKLLRNVIPESTAEELKKKGRARARAYKTVSVIFTDFVGFTKISDKMNPTELVKKLDVFFTKFDEIIVKNNLEKIKTIGDAYMCAGGVPVRNNTNPIDACLAALQIQAYMMEHKNNAIANGEEYWELRLGINTGDVTAGVIGSERLAYDIWGATVNKAQRMEMLGEAGKVTITGATFGHIEPYFECTFKGKAQTKSSGIVDMYVVDRIKPELSIRGEGVFPNERFNQIVNLHHYSSINYYKAERHIMKVLEAQLSDKLYYHSINHTKDVVSAVEHLALSENVTDEGLFLLKSAATYHDAGFIEQYDNNEPVGARLAAEILPKYGYTEAHIEEIKRLIFVTQIPHDPKNKLEEIICDADLDYLGRDDFHEIADKLRRELLEHGKITSSRQWDEIQVSFLMKHRYFTETAIRTRKTKKQLNLQEVVDRLERNVYED